MSRGRLFRAGWLLLAWLRTLPAEAAHRPIVELVLDGSKEAGPSWDLQRRALARAFGTLKQPPRAELRVRVTGGPTLGGCDEVRDELPTGDLITIKPGGPRNLAATLEAVSGDLGGVVAARAVVVVTTGPDGCGRDVCATAEALRRGQGLGAVRVIGLGWAGPALTCLANPKRVATEAELAAALVESMEATFVPGELTVSVPEPKGRIDVEVYHQGEEALAASGRAGEPMPLGSGAYDVRAYVTDAHGAVRREGWARLVEVKSGEKVPLRIALAKGPARVTVRVRLNGLPAPGGTRITLHRPGRKDDEVASGYADEPFDAPPGRWDVRAAVQANALGELDVWREAVEMQAGADVALTLDARQKQALVRAWAEAAGEPVDEAALMVLAPGTRGDSDWSLEPHTPTALPEGTYTIAARLETPGGELRGYRDGVKVGAEGEQDVVVELAPNGWLEVRPPKDGEGWNMLLVRPGGRERDASWYDVGQPWRVPAGRYDVKLERGGLPPALRWVRGVVVKARERTVVDLGRKGG